MKCQYDIQVSDYCNLKCKHCLMDSSLHQCVVDYDKIIDTLKDRYVETIYLSGGEPLVDEESTNGILKIMNTYPNVEYKLVTNLCYDMTPERREVLDRVNSLQTSFDIEIRFGNMRNLMRWYRNCRELLSTTRPDLEVICTITKHIINKGPEKIIKLFHHMGFNAYKFAVASHLGTFSRNKDLWVTKEEHIEFMNKMLDIKDTKNGTIKEIKEHTWTACKYMELQPINQRGDLVHCAAWEKVNSPCLNNVQCLMCKDYRYCGGRCCSTPCMFDKSIYDRVMNEFYGNNIIRSELEK